MPLYNYACGKPREERCKIVNLPKEFFDGEDIGVSVNLRSRLTVYSDDSIDAEKSPIVWFMRHGMFENADVKCPVCEGKAIKIISDVISYFPGNYFLDIAGCKRQMNLHKLKTNDPYGYMRPEGEKDYLIKKLERGDKTEPKYFYPGGSGGLSHKKPDYRDS